MSNNKRAGTLYESMFKVEAMKRGLHVSETEGDYLPYDCIVDNGTNLFRIQVKGTASPRGKTGYSIGTAMGAKTSEKNRYNDNDFDVLAALVVGDGATHWYLIPRDKLGKNLTIKLFPTGVSKGRWERYRHSWDLLC
jgi:hypothetical protein